MWRWCWCWALPKWWRGEYRYLVVRWSKYIKGVPHVMLTNDLKDAEIAEAVPVGEKKKGLAGVVHALTSKWTVRKGKDE